MHFLIQQQQYGVGFNIIPILQMKNLRMTGVDGIDKKCKLDP